MRTKTNRITLTTVMILAFFSEWVPKAISAEIAPAGPPQPIWTREVKLIGSPPQRLAILGAEENGKFVPWSVSLPERPTPASLSVSFPLKDNLVPTLAFRSFGVEERVTIGRQDGRLNIRCRPGLKPAGALLSLKGFHFPRRMQGELVLRGRGEGYFHAAIAQQGQEPRHFTELSYQAPQKFEAPIPSDAWTSLELPEELVITCSRSAGELSLSAIEIEPRPRQPLIPSGTWIWEVGTWLDRGGQLVSELRRSDIGEVFIQVQIAKGAIVERKALLTLIRELAAAGVRVNAVEGDGKMAGPSGRAFAVERARLLAGLKAETEGKLQSFQFDIEPYTLPEFESDPAFWWNGWGTTLTEVATAVGEPVSAVVPFWLLQHPVAERALLRARGSISRIVVMSYRTEAGAVEQIAESWLDWGGRNGVPVAFALETGFVPTEFQHHYFRAERGTVLLEVMGSTARLLLFDEPVLGAGNRLAYSFGYESKIGSERITFWNDREKLTKVRGRLRANLAAWMAFDGLLVHEILGP